MKESVVYVCEYCEKKYEEKEWCEKCEAQHKKNLKIVEVKDYYKSCCAGFPRYIVVEADDGTQRTYGDYSLLRD